MFDSLKSWMVVPIKVKVFNKFSGSGNKEFKYIVSLNGYVTNKTKMLTSETGLQLTSFAQVFVDGILFLDEKSLVAGTEFRSDFKPFKVSRNDVIVIDNDEEFNIKAINIFFDNGKPDIREVIL